jgi:hypothetical protein
MTEILGVIEPLLADAPNDYIAWQYLTGNTSDLSLP